LSCYDYGKKSAIRTGINIATGQIITTIDADCIPTLNWLGAIANSYNSTKATMLIGPVKMIADTSLFSRFQSFDFMALQMSGAGAAMQGWPVFCSGANLTFEKSAWQTAQSTLSGQEQASGDDVFLLHAFKKLGLPIAFNKDEAAMVSTHTEKTLKSFLKQRMRWGGKSKSYNDVHTILLAILVLFANLSVLFALVSGLFNLTYLVLFLILFAIKLIADYHLIMAGQVFFGNKPAFLPFLLFSMVYPFYIILAAFGGLLLNTTWKGRK
jgi:cellulose synthase/poly-beta-1,6-N-acetylglucosamine synthase-like glycosyltransferase